MSRKPRYKSKRLFREGEGQERKSVDVVDGGASNALAATSTTVYTVHSNPSAGFAKHGLVTLQSKQEPKSKNSHERHEQDPANLHYPSWHLNVKLFECHEYDGNAGGDYYNPYK